MNMLLFLIPALSTQVFAAQTLMLDQGQATYTVKHLIKRVQGTSTQLKGKIVCSETECEILVAAPIKSFVSSDSNRDHNMQMTMEETKFPLATAKGKFPVENLTKDKWELPLEVDLHGVKKQYSASIINTKDNSQKASLIISLDAHTITRPSLLTIKIADSVPMEFNLKWTPVKPD